MSNIPTTQSVKTTKLSGKVWLSAILFGLIGQIAWSVENMYFAKMAQDIGANVGNVDWGTIVSTLMIWLSAIAATAITALHMNKRNACLKFSIKRSIV